MGSEHLTDTVVDREGKKAVDNSVENVLDSLVPRERHVLGLMAQGFSNKTIAGKLLVNQKTVEKDINHIFRKIGVSSEDSAVDTRVRSVLLYQTNTIDFKNPFEEYCHILPLSPRQKEVVSLIGKGYSNTEIARQLNISLNTVENYIHTVLEEKIPVDKQTYSPRVLIALVSQTSQVT